MKTIGICIPTYNRDQILIQSIEKTIEAIGKFQIPIYISDNNSFDRTQDVVFEIKQKYKHIHYRKNIENLGSDRNIEEVLKYCNQDYCWLMGDDDFVGENFSKLYSKINYLEADAYVIVRNPKFYPEGVYRLIDIFPEIINEVCFISLLIFSKQIVEKGAFEKYSGTEYVHVGVLLEYLIVNPLAKVGILYDDKYILQTRPGFSAYSKRVPEILLVNLSNTIRLLPLANSYSVAKNNIKSLLGLGGGLSPNVALSLREKSSLNRKQIKRLSDIIKPVSCFYYYRLIGISLIPIWLLRLGKKMYVFFKRVK